MGSSSGGVTTVEDQLGTGHPLGRIGCQIQHRAGDVGRLAKATDRMGGLDRAFGRRVVGSETQIDEMRSEERRVGKERVSTCRYVWSSVHEKKKKTEQKMKYKYK